MLAARGCSADLEGGRLLDRSGRAQSLWKAAWLLVPSGGRPVKAAIEAARDGDKIRLKPGTYSDAINISAGVEVALPGQ